MTKQIETIPNKNNFCGGNYQDWLEVMLINKCNGNCSWCIEKKGFKPLYSVDWVKMFDAIMATNKKNILLLGGEPTLYPHIRELIKALHNSHRNVYLTTNGSMLSARFVKNNLKNLSGINISIHHYDLDLNDIITDINLDNGELISAIEELQNNGTTVRLNCNCIRNEIDSMDKILRYVNYAKFLGAGSVRFAELKNEKGNFVNLYEITKDHFSEPLNDDPFIQGCNVDRLINGLPVNFRLMCGLQTPLRKEPINPVQEKKQVLYNDGIVYDGWQQAKVVQAKKKIKRSIKGILADVKAGKLSEEKGEKEILALQEKEVKIAESSSGGGCQY